MRGQFIDESTRGLAFAFQDYGGNYKNIGANAKPLQSIFTKMHMLEDALGMYRQDQN